MDKRVGISIILAIAFISQLWGWNERVQAQRQAELYRQQIEGMKDALGYTH